MRLGNGHDSSSNGCQFHDTGCVEVAETIHIELSGGGENQVSVSKACSDDAIFDFCPNQYFIPENPPTKGIIVIMGQVLDNHLIFSLQPNFHSFVAQVTISNMSDTD